MTQVNEPCEYHPDSAAIFASALSLWQACMKHKNDKATVDFSECYNGVDQLMREMLRIANLFEAWACLHIAFEEWDEVWPYFLEDKFGEICLDAVSPSSLGKFEERDCLRVAMRLHLPIRLDDALPIPIDERVSNPVSESEFKEYRIQSVRSSTVEDFVSPFCAGDEPFDENYTAPYFGLYGVDDEGFVEHIADRTTYAEALCLINKMVSDLEFSVAPLYSGHVKS